VRVSVVIPIFDEEEVLPLLLERMRAVLDKLPPGSELVLVNDGSRDRSVSIIGAASLADKRVKLVDLSRNFGHSAAISAGLDNAVGDVVVTMDGDLQDPPELIPEMLALHDKGYDVVHATRRSRAGEGPFKRATAWLFYRLMGLASDKSVVHVGEFRLMGKEVVDAIRAMRERHRVVRGLVGWVGFQQTVIEFDRPARAAGSTKYPLTKMMRLAWDALTSFSTVPLRIATFIGLCALVFGTGYGGWAFYEGFIKGDAVPGWTSLVVLQTFLFGALFVCIGLIGEYVGRIFEEVKGRPLYIVRKRAAEEPRDGS
jgi:dolichol-phosphate mannosyltransferase